MKKIVSSILIIALLVMMLMLSGCNKQIIDLNYHFNYAIIQLPNGEIVEGAVQSWTDFEDGDQIQVKIDGVTYLVHSANIVLEAR